MTDFGPTTYCGLTLETYRMSVREANRLYNEAIDAEDLDGVKRWFAERGRLIEIVNNWKVLTDGC